MKEYLVATPDGSTQEIKAAKLLHVGSVETGSIHLDFYDAADNLIAIFREWSWWRLKKPPTQIIKLDKDKSEDTSSCRKK